MKRFTLVLDDWMFEAFLRCYPDHGNRTAVLRKVIRKLIKRKDALPVGEEAEEIVTEVFKEVDKNHHGWGGG